MLSVSFFKFFSVPILIFIKSMHQHVRIYSNGQNSINIFFHIYQSQVGENGIMHIWICNVLSFVLVFICLEQHRNNLYTCTDCIYMYYIIEEIHIRRTYGIQYNVYRSG